MAPIHRPSHRPNLRASWLQGRGYVQVCQSPLAWCLLGHQFSLSHPSLQAWWHLGPLLKKEMIVSLIYLFVLKHSVNNNGIF